jgi:hypothetical protein
MPGRPIEQGLQVRLVVANSADEQRLPVIVEDIGEMLVLPDIEPDPQIHRPGNGHPHPFLHTLAWSNVREGRRWDARRHPPYESAIKTHVPIRGSRTDRAGGSAPRPYQLQGQ